MSKTFKKAICTTYEWWRTDGKDVREEDENELMLCADERIKEQAAEGFTSGELNADIFKDDKSDETLAYRGSWETFG